MSRIFEFQFKLKPDVNENEMLRLLNEVAFPILRKVPGLISVSVLKYTDETPEWDYTWFEVWENEEAHQKAVSDKYIRGEDSQLGKTGYYEESYAMIEKWQSAFGTIIASTK